MNNEIAIEMQGDYLDYVWIKKYRNITESGYHFSRKYQYSFDSQKQVLTRTEMPEGSFISGFFDNKVEVNAVVGVNGRGKTSILRAVFEAVHSSRINANDSDIKGVSENSDTFSEIVFAFRNGFVYCCYSNSTWIESEFETDNRTCDLKKARLKINGNSSNRRQKISHFPLFYHSLTLDYGTFSRFQSEVRQTNTLALSDYDISTSALLSSKEHNGLFRSEKKPVTSFLCARFAPCGALGLPSRKLMLN